MKTEELKKRIAEAFDKVSNKGEKEITNLYNEEMKICGKSPAKLRILYAQLESMLWKSHNEKSNAYNLYKKLHDQTKDYAIKNFTFSQLSDFFNN